MPGHLPYIRLINLKHTKNEKNYLHYDRLPAGIRNDGLRTGK